MPRGRPLKALDVSQGDQPPRVTYPLLRYHLLC